MQNPLSNSSFRASAPELHRQLQSALWFDALVLLLLLQLMAVAVPRALHVHVVVCAVACFSCLLLLPSSLLLSLQAQWICIYHHFLLLPAPRSPPWRRLSNICCARRHRPCSILHRFYGCVARLHSTCCTLHTHKPLANSMNPQFCCGRLPAVPVLSFL